MRLGAPSLVDPERCVRSPPRLPAVFVIVSPGFLPFPPKSPRGTKTTNKNYKQQQTANGRASPTPAAGGGGNADGTGGDAAGAAPSKGGVPPVLVDGGESAVATVVDSGEDEKSANAAGGTGADATDVRAWLGAVGGVFDCFWL